MVLYCCRFYFSNIPHGFSDRCEKFSGLLTLNVGVKGGGVTAVRLIKSDIADTLYHKIKAT